jgi:hypothetical protein
LLKQQSSIAVYGLLTKKTNFCFLFPFAANKRKFAVSAFSKQAEVAVSVRSIFRFSEFRKIGRHGHMEVETWKYVDRDMRQGNVEKWRHGDMDV